MSGPVKKIVLAYSGGLDTSVILRWLQDTYKCEVVTFTADLGQGEDLSPVRGKAELMGMNRNEVSAFSMMAWDDRVSRDLGIPYHKVKMEYFEEWYEKGFRAQPGEFNAKNITPEEDKRIIKLAQGSALRK